MRKFKFGASNIGKTAVKLRATRVLFIISVSVREMEREKERNRGERESGVKVCLRCPRSSKRFSADGRL